MIGFISIIIGVSTIIGLISIFGVWLYDSEYKSLFVVMMDDEFKWKWLRMFMAIWVGVLVCFLAISLIVFGVSMGSS